MEGAATIAGGFFFKEVPDIGTIQIILNWGGRGGRLKEAFAGVQKWKHIAFLK